MALNWTNAQVLNQLNSGYKWSLPTIYYAFPTSASGMFSQGEATTFRPIPSAQQPIFAQAIQAWDELIPQAFAQTYANTSNIEFAYSTSNIDYAHAYFPTNGSAWFKTASDVAYSQIGSYGFLTIMHEIGHALGLNHMGDYNGSGSWIPSSYQDSTVFSIMSYFGPRGTGSMPSSEVAGADWISADFVAHRPQTPMLNDVMVIQAMYGVSTTTRTSDTVYGFSTNITDTSANWFDFTRNKNPVLTIFDSAGKDTLNLSGWSTPSTIYLESGVYSSCNDMTNNIVIAYNCTIENAVGGSGNDTITGNTVANRLEGGAGNDVLAGGGGDDTLVGGSGNDVIRGGLGSDTVVFSGTFSSYSVTYNAITFSYTVAGTQDGTDTVYDVEFFQFSDITKTFSQTTATDTASPTLLSVSPVDGATNTAIGANFVFTLSEAVKAGTGAITIFNNDGTVAKTIATSDTGQVTFSGATVTVNPVGDLVAGRSYYINVAPGAIVDLSGNSFAGITGNTAYNFATQAPVVTDDYPWSTATTGVVAVNGSASSGVIESLDDADLFKVALVAGTTYVFDLVSVTGGLADPYLWLYSPTIDLLTSNDDGGTGNNSQIIYKPTQSGTFYLGAADFGSGLGAYKISAITQTGNDDYSANTSTTGVLPIGGQVTGTIEIAKDEDWFKINLQAGTTYTFELKGFDSNGGTLGAGTSHQPYLSLYDTSGYFKNSTASGGVGGDPLLTFTPSVSGSYYISAEDLYSTGTGTYTLKATTVGIFVDDYRADISTTGMLSIGGQVTGNIEVANDQDWFKVSLLAGTTYTFELKGFDSNGGTLGSGTSHQPYLSLYDSNGYYKTATASGGTGGDPLLSFTPTVSGTYFLAADDLYSTGTGTYTLKATSAGTVTDDFPWSTATTGVVSVNGVPTNGVIESVNDGDLFKVILTAGTTYTFDLIGTAGGLADSYLRLYSPDVVQLSSDDDSGDLLNSRITYTATTSGTYYLGAEASASGTGAYKISATTVADDFPWSTATTGVVAVNGTATNGVINFTSDKDLFKVTLTAGTTYTFDLIGNAGGLSDAYLRLYGTDVVQISSDDDGGDLLNARITYTATTSGTYYLGAEASGSETGAYKISATTVTDDFPWSTATTGVVAVNGTATNGVINFATDKDLFKVTLTAGTTYTFNLIGAAGGLADSYLRLYSPDIVQLSSDDDSGDLLNSRITYTATTSGTYYLGAEASASGTGAYKISATTANVDLTPFQPSGWSDKIVVSTVTGGNTDSSTIYSDQILYVDLAVSNTGSANSSTTFHSNLYLDGAYVTGWYTTSLTAGNYASVNDYVLGTLSVGTHTLKFVTDATGVITESIESNNEYTKTITVAARGTNTMVGTAAADSISNSPGNDAIDGGAGIDTVVYRGTKKNFELGFANGKWVIHDKTNNEGTDSVANVEKLQFADKTIYIESQTHGTYADLPESLWHFFIVAFNAAPGVQYMDQLAEAYRYGLSVKQIVDIFTTKSQFTDVYPIALSHQDMATALVSNIVKGSASPEVKQSAVADIKAALGIGWSVGDVIYTVFGNLANKSLADATWGNTAHQFQNQIAVAKYYTATMNQSTTDLATLRSVLDPVTATSDVSTDASLVTLVGIGLLGSSA